MTYDEAQLKARAAALRCDRTIAQELQEQCVSDAVASVVSFSMAKAIDDVVHYLTTRDLCSRAQFMRALEILLRNKAKLMCEQVMLFSDNGQSDAR